MDGTLVNMSGLLALENVKPLLDISCKWLIIFLWIYILIKNNNEDLKWKIRNEYESGL